MVGITPISAASAPVRPSPEQVWDWLRSVTDPEIPVLSVVDLGIVRDVAWSEEADAYVVTITPTYSGCPATAIIQSRIREDLERHGIRRVRLRIQLSPAWTTDWLSPQARESLREFGIAPPTGHASQLAASILPVLASDTLQPTPHCPRCGSTRTSPISQFGSTLCKALYRCHDCLEPFDYFKCH
jgi:ring-1,2-phenylacetyl-CoA epoxidase subunit PaaD